MVLSFLLSASPQPLRLQSKRVCLVHASPMLSTVSDIEVQIWQWLLFSSLVYLYLLIHTFNSFILTVITNMLELISDISFCIFCILAFLASFSFCFIFISSIFVLFQWTVPEVTILSWDTPLPCSNLSILQHCSEAHPLLTSSDRVRGYNMSRCSCSGDSVAPLP